MMYEIEIDYTTGDSFGSENLTETVGCVWADLEKAKIALQYIQEHYKYYEEKNSFSPYDKAKRKVKDYSHRLWYREDYPEGGLKVPVEDGYQDISAFWCGYFETLHGAKIINQVDDDLAFTL